VSEHRPYRANEDAQDAIESLRATVVRALHEQGVEAAEHAVAEADLSRAHTSDAVARVRKDLPQVKRLSGESWDRAATSAYLAKGHSQITGTAAGLRCGACGRTARLERWSNRHYLLGEGAKTRCPGIRASGAAA